MTFPAASGDDALDWIGIFFILNGGVTAVVLCVAMVVLFGHGGPPELRAVIAAHPVKAAWGVANGLATAGGWIYTGHLLRHRRRLGAYMALATFGLMLLRVIVTGDWSLLDLLFIGVGGVVIRRRWHELD